LAPDDVTGAEGASAALEPLPASRDRRPAYAKAYEGRFSVAYLALAVIVAGAIIAFALVLKDRKASTARWSTWQPSSNGLAGAREIGEHVSARYRLANGDQLVAPLVAPLSVRGVPISQVAVRNDPGNRNVLFFDATFPTNTPYTLCGLGQNCAVTGGKVSPVRAKLIRREAVELALYNFKYMKGVDSILAYLPPAPGAQLTNVLFLRKSDVAPLLQRPLARSLTGRGPFVAGKPVPNDALITRLTNERVFKFDFQQIPDGTAIIVATPLELSS
jgi:hypothetical protein